MKAINGNWKTKGRKDSKRPSQSYSVQTVSESNAPVIFLLPARPSPMDVAAYIHTCCIGGPHRQVWGDGARPLSLSFPLCQHAWCEHRPQGQAGCPAGRYLKRRFSLTPCFLPSPGPASSHRQSAVSTYDVQGIPCFYHLQKQEGAYRGAVECRAVSWAHRPWKSRPAPGLRLLRTVLRRKSFFLEPLWEPKTSPSSRSRQAGSKVSRTPGDIITFSNQVLDIRLVASNLLGPRPAFPGLPPPFGSFPSSFQPEAC